MFNFGWEDGGGEPPPGASTVTVTLEPEPGGTRVRLVHQGLTDEQEEAHSRGWEHFMERLSAAGREGDAGLDPMQQRYPEGWDSLAAAEANLAVCQLVLRQMGPGDGKAQTPCARFDVDQLAEHLCGSLVALGGGIGLTVAADEGAPLEPRLADLAQPVLEGWRRRGLEGTVRLGRETCPPRAPPASLHGVAGACMGLRPCHGSSRPGH